MMIGIKGRRGEQKSALRQITGHFADDFSAKHDNIGAHMIT
jgi:hypothetical protein